LYNHGESDAPDYGSYRSSKGAYHVPKECKKLVVEKVAALAEVGVDQIESFAMSVYEPGQHYLYHYDQDNLYSSHGRFCTVLVYLNEECEGGRTLFPRLRLAVKPRTGRAVVFNYGERFDSYNCLHGGEQVTRGTKYVLNVFIHRAVAGLPYSIYGYK